MSNRGCVRFLRLSRVTVGFWCKLQNVMPSIGVGRTLTALSVHDETCEVSTILVRSVGSFTVAVPAGDDPQPSLGMM